MARGRSVKLIVAGLTALILLGLIGTALVLVLRGPGGAPPNVVEAKPDAKPVDTPKPVAADPKPAEPSRPTVAESRPVEPRKPDTAAPKTPTKVADVAPPTVDPRPPADGKRRVWSVVIGIDGYNDDGDIPIGRGAEFSALSFGKWLKESAGWDDSNILLLIDRGAKQPIPKGKSARNEYYPTLANLKAAFAEWLPARIRDGDLVVVYYAGQMVALPAPAGSVPGTAGRGRILAVDTRASAVDLTGFALEEAIADIAMKGKNPIACFLDSSLMGRAKPVKTALAASKPDEAGFLRTLARWPDVTVWMAATGKLSSQPVTNGVLTPFTQALVESFGTRSDPYNLLDSVTHLQRDARTVKEGFAKAGSVAPDLTLWSSELKLPPPHPPELLIQRGHAQPVSELRYQGDGAILATGAPDSTVRLWRVADRTLLRVLRNHVHGVTTLAISDSGRFVASGDAKGKVQIWDTRDRLLKLPAEVPAHESTLTGLDFLPDSDRLLSRDREGAVWLTTLSEFNRGVKRIAVNTRGAVAANNAGPVAFVVAANDWKIQRFGRDGSPLPKTLDAPSGQFDTLRICSDGARVVCARDRELLLWDEASGTVRDRKRYDAAVDLVELRGDRLAVATGSKVHLHRVANGKLGEPQVLSLSQAATHLVLAEATELLAVRSKDGVAQAWRLSDAEAPLLIRLLGEPGLVTSVAFSPDGKTLAAGNQDGGVRFWELATGEQLPSVTSRRGQIVSLSVSGDGRHLLQVDYDGDALLWDLFEGRNLSVLPPVRTPSGAVSTRWSAGIVTADGKTLVLASHPSGTNPGEIVVVDRESAATRGPDAARVAPFVRPVDPDAGDAPMKAPFRNLTLHEGAGRKLVAASVGHVVCVWDYLTGALIYTIRGHDDTIGTIRAVDFGPEAKTLATAGEDGVVFVWDLARANPNEPSQPVRIARFAIPRENTHATAVRFLPSTDPKAPVRLAVGSRDGDVLLIEAGKPQPIFTFASGLPEVSGLAVTANRDYLVASFRDKTMLHWRISTSPPRRIAPMRPYPHHDEEIRALIPWPNRPMVASGSDDTTIRLWDLEGQKLVGVLSSGEGANDWVAFAPNGRFDCAVGAERHLTWLRNNEVFPVEQFGERLRVPGLPALLSKAEAIPAPEEIVAERPRIAIDPPAAIKADSEKLHLSVALSTPGVLDLRLYQDGIPVRDASDFKLSPDGRFATVDVTLHNGRNRFYAMGGLDGSIDGRSNDVEIRYDKPDPPGELHILALGVGNYDKADRRLKYAKKDAEDITNFLKSKGVKGSNGLTFILRDDEVSLRNVQEHLRTLRNRVRDRPQDAVAVFLAGHTDVVGNKFSLLRTGYPFNAGGQIESSSVIAFAAIYQYVAYLGCQQRLMIVDACRSGEILKDRGVEIVRREIDSDAHRGRTSYILAAARAGALAGESDVLEHGLLTYSLLRGMGADGLKPVTFTDVFETNRTADRDRNKVVDAEELSWYADLTVPKLASSIPLLVQRSGVSRSSARPASPAPGAPETPTPPAPAAIPLVPVP